MVRIDDSGSEVKCWLDYPEEVERVEAQARKRDWEQEVLIQLCARVGARISGAVGIKPSDVSWNPKGEYWQVEVRGKNTKGGAKTTRDAYLPNRVKENLDRYQSERRISDDETYITVSKSRARDWVREITNEIATETSEDRWQYVSSHDLRRSWATHHLVEKNRSVRVMMAIGGWSSYEAIEPYLTEPTASKIAEEMGDAV